MKSTKVFAAVFAGLVGGGAGCGGGGKNVAATPTPAPMASSTSTPTPMPSATPVNYGYVPTTQVINGMTVGLNIDSDGLEYYDTTIVTGLAAMPGQTATVFYRLYLVDGTVLESGNFAFVIEANPEQVIPGFDQGIEGMLVGSKRRLVIPPNLGYGANPPSGSGIPANATLIYDVTLLSLS